MMRLFLLELRRLLKQRRILALFIIAPVLAVVFAFLPTNYVISNGDVSMNGREHIAQLKVQQSAIAGPVSDNAIREAVETYRDTLHTYDAPTEFDLPDGVAREKLVPIEPLYQLVPVQYLIPSTDLLSFDITTLDDYDALCENAFANRLAGEQANPVAQEKAAAMYAQIDRPFVIAPGASSDALDYFVLLGFFLLFACTFITAPAFTSAYQTGADDIFRCTRHGRSRLGAARIAATLFICALLSTLTFVLYFLLSNTLFGWDTLDASIQTMSLFGPLALGDYTLGQLQPLLIAGGVLCILASMSVMLFFSAKIRSLIAIFGIGFIFCLLPNFLYMTVTGPLFAWCMALIPTSGLVMQSSLLYAMRGVEFVTIGGFSLWLPEAMMLVCACFLPLFIALALHAYCRHKA